MFFTAHPSKRDSLCPLVSFFSRQMLGIILVTEEERKLLTKTHSSHVPEIQ